MPTYVFECSNGHRIEQYLRLVDFVDTLSCSSCGLVSRIVIQPVAINVFKPYVESNFTGKPIEITTAEQRDALCEKHGVTYDTYKYHRKKKVSSAVDSVDFREVKRTAERGKTDDGETIQGTVSATID